MADGSTVASILRIRPFRSVSTRYREQPAIHERQQYRLACRPADQRGACLYTVRDPGADWAANARAAGVGFAKRSGLVRDGTPDEFEALAGELAVFRFDLQE